MLSFRQYLTEIKMSRVLFHFKAKGYPVSVITAFRGDKTRAQNVSNNKALATTVRNAGYGFVWVEGKWTENRDTPEEQDVAETSMMVIGDEKLVAEKVTLKNRPELFDLMVEQSKKWSQDAFLYKDHNAQIAFYSKTGKRETPIMRNINLRKFEFGWTELRSGNPQARVFSVSEAWVPAGWMARQLIRDPKILDNECI